MFSRNVRDFADIGVAGVGSASYCGQHPSLTSSTFGQAISVGGFGVSAKTLSGLNGNKPLPNYL